jgi:hypothetical protein
MSLFNGNWTGTKPSGFDIASPGPTNIPSTSAAMDMELIPFTPSANIQPANNPAPQAFCTFLLMPIVDITVNEETLLTFVFCAAEVFEKGIVFKTDFMRSTLPLASICIHDTKVLVRQHLNLHSLLSDTESFCRACRAHFFKILTIAKHASQPPELGKHGHKWHVSQFTYVLAGIQCQETNDTKPLIMGCDVMMEQVCFSFVAWMLSNTEQMIFFECLKFIKSLKDVGIPLIHNLQKAHSEGFCTGNYDAQSISAYINSLMGLMSWDSEVTSVKFMHCSKRVSVISHTFALLIRSSGCQI